MTPLYITTLRYGRYAAAAMERKLETYEKEKQMLHRALRKSDVYVEEVERQLDKYQSFVELYSTCPVCSATLVKPDEAKIPGQSSVERNQKPDGLKTGLNRVASWPNTLDTEGKPKALISSVSFYGRKPTLVKATETVTSGASSSELDTPTKREDSFGLEQPSPCTPSIVMKRLAIQCDGSDTSMDQSLEYTTQFNTTDLSDVELYPTSTESCRKKLRFEASNDLHPSTSGYKPTQNLNFENDSDSLSDMRFPRKGSKLGNGKSEADVTFEMPSSNLDSEDYDANMTRDITECMELLDAAEWKVKKLGSYNTQGNC